MPSSPTTTTWTGQAGSNDFTTAQNWSAGVPTAVTDALINGSSAAPLTIVFAAGTLAVAAKSLSTTFTTLDVNGGSLSIAGASTLDALDQTGGLLDFANSGGVGSAFTGAVTQTAGTLQVDAGSLALAAGGALGGTIGGGGTVLNSGTLAVDGLTAAGAAVLENQATVTLGSGTFTLGRSAQSTATLQNDAAGTFDFTGDGTIAAGGTLAGFANAGLLEKSGGTGTSSIAASFGGGGEVLANSGTLAFLSANTYTGTIDGIGTVAFDAPNNTLGAGAVLTVAAVALGGTLDLAADIAYGGFLLTSTNVIALGTSTLTLSNAADNLHNATILGSGTLANDDTLAVDGVTVGGQAVLENQGTATLAGGTLALGDGSGSTAMLQNDPGGVFDLTGDGSVSGGSLDGRPGVAIANAGIFEKSGGTGTSEVDAPFNGDGIVFASSGVLAFENSNSYTGTIAGTGAIAFDGNTNTLAAGLVLAVATIEAGGTLVFQSDLAITGVLSAGAQHLALGTHTLTLSNAGDDLLNTRVDGAGTLKSTAALAVDGLVLNGGALFDNAGTATLGGATMQIGDSATSDAGLLNEAGAVFDFTGNGDILDGSSSLSPKLSITNAGLFEETGGVGSNVGVAFSSTGTVRANGGVFSFEGGGTFGGTIAGSGMVALAGASNTLAAGVVVTVATLVAGGRLLLAGDVSYAGELIAAGQTLLPGGHTLTLNNGLDDIIGSSLLGGGQVVNRDTLALDAVTVGGSVALANLGTAELVGEGLTLGDSASSTASLVNLAGGTFEMLSGGSIMAGSGATKVSVINDGVFQAGGGQFDVFAPFSNAFKVLVTTAGLTLHAANDLSGGMLAGGVWDATGTIDFAAGGVLATDAAQITLDGASSALLSTPVGSATAVALEATLTSIAAGGVLSLLNGRSFVGEQAISDNGIVVLTGGTLAAASFTMEANSTLTGFGTVAPAIAGGALIEAFGGDLVLNGGTGFAVIQPAATLELAASFGGIVEFATGATATMALDAPGDFTGTIDGLANGDTIDFKNTTVSHAALSGSTLLVTIGTATTTYDLGAPVPGVGALIEADASGTGSNVVLSSASFAQAVAQINTASPIDFGNLHMGAAGQGTLSVANAATAPAEGLDATVTPAGGSATAHGSFDLLAAGQTDSTDLIVGLTASAPGVASGSVDVGFFSDGSGTSGNGKTALADQTVQVTGTFYQRATASVAAPVNAIVHVGDGNGTATVQLTVANTAPADGFSENLLAAATGMVTGGLLGASGSSGEVAPATTLGASVIATSGLVGHWAADGNAVDTSPTGNDGTFAGSFAGGVSGQAFDLATGGVVVPNNTAYDFSAGFSVGFWFNFNGQTPAAWDMIGQDVGPGSNPKWFVDYDYDHPGALELLFSPPFGGPFNAVVVNTAPITPTGWNQFTATWTGSEFDIYLNGSLDGSAAYSGAFPAPNAPLQFGLNDGGVAFPGLMDDVVLYNRALSAAEVQALAGAGTGIDASFSTAAAGVVSGVAAVASTSDGTGIDGLGQSSLGTTDVAVSATVDNYATAAIEQTGGAGSLAGSGNTVTLDFGTLALGAAAVTADLGVLNSASGPADVLAGSFSGGEGAGFTDNGFVSFAGLSAESAGVATNIVFTPGTAGTYSETITLAPVGSNASGYSAALADETLVVVGAVGTGGPALAQPRLNTNNPFDFGALRAGTATSEPLTISNTATKGAQGLDVTAVASGAAIVSGTINDLAGGTTIFNAMTASLGTATAGVAQGSITLAFGSDNNGTVTPLTGQDITLDLSGTIYAEASFAASTPAPVLLHVGDSGAGVVVVHNTVPAPFGENLEVSVASTTELQAGAAIGPIAPQSSADIGFTIDTDTAGTIAGKIGLAFSSDGTGIDNAGPTAIGTQTIAVAAVVNNYATATLQASKGTLTQNGGSYTLDLGTVGVGAGPQTADLIVLNSAIGPADFLSGTLQAGGNSGFIESDAGTFSNLAAGGSVDIEQLTLDPTETGVFTATFTLAATGANVSGFSAPVAGATVTVQETVGTGPGIFATVLGAGGSTVTIPFTSVANAAAAQIALNPISAAVLAETFTQLDYDGSGTQTAGTPQVGLVELNNSTVPLAPLVLGDNTVSAVLDGTASQTVLTGLLGDDTVAVGAAGGGVVNMGTNTKVFFGGGGVQMFAEANLGFVFARPSADVWLDGNAAFDDSAGDTHIHIATVPGGAGATATALTVIDNGAGTTTIDIGSDTTGTAQGDVISFNGAGSAATTVNAAGSAGAGGVPLIAYVGTGSGFINANGSNVTVYGGSTGAVTLLGGAGTDVDAGAGGLIEAGSGGGSRLFGSTVPGTTTLVGGGDGDLLAADGKNTVLIAGVGNESLYAFQPSTLEGFAGTQTPGATTWFTAATGGNTYLPGNGQTSIASAADSNGGNLFQERVSGAANSATISGFVTGVDSISGVNPAGGQYSLVTNRAPGAQEMSLTVNGSTSVLTFGDGTTWTFTGVVQVSDFVNVASRGGV